MLPCLLLFLCTLVVTILYWDFGFPNGQADFIGFTKHEVVAWADKNRNDGDIYIDMFDLDGNSIYKQACRFGDVYKVETTPLFKTSTVWLVNQKQNGFIQYWQKITFKDGKIIKQEIVKERIPIT